MCLTILDYTHGLAKEFVKSVGLDLARVPDCILFKQSALASSVAEPMSTLHRLTLWRMAQMQSLARFIGFSATRWNAQHLCRAHF